MNNGYIRKEVSFCCAPPFCGARQLFLMGHQVHEVLSDHAGKLAQLWTLTVSPVSKQVA